MTYSSTGGSADRSYNRMYVSVGDLPAFRRYKMTIPSGAFVAGTLEAQGSNPGPAAEYAFEFVKLANTTVYSYMDMAVSASAASTEEALSFSLQLHKASGAFADVSEFTVCYCDDQKDGTLEDMGDGDSTYKIVDDLKCSDPASLVFASVVTEVVADRTIAEHQCETKCVKGCTGPYCYCDGYDATADPAMLCLPPSLCREACDGLPGVCGGINVHDSKPQCILLPAATPSAPSPCVGAALNMSTTPDLEFPEELGVAEDWQLFTKHAGTACTHLADYQERAGSLYITSRVEVAVDYVLHPGENGSIELTAPVALEDSSLTFQHSKIFGFTADKLLSKDRITIIDCKGTCGVSSPTAAVTVPAAGNKIETWNNLSPFSWFVDLPAIDEQNPQDPEAEMRFHPAKGSNTYNPRSGFYCPHSNIDLDMQVFPFGGVRRPLKDHQCHVSKHIK